MINNQRGFTLMEMLVAMSLLVVLSSLSIFLVTSQQTSLKETHFLAQLEGDLYYAQAFALENQIPIQVRIYPTLHYYYMRADADTGNIVERYYADDVIFSTNATLSFNILCD